MSAETVIYKIDAPNGQTYRISGPAGASQEEVQAEVLRQHPDAGKLPTQEQLKGNIINSDVPTVVGERPNPPQIAEPKRTIGDYAKAAYEIPLTAASSALAEPIGAAYGVYKGITSPEYGTQQGLQKAQSEGAQIAQKLRYSPESPVTQDAFNAVNQVMDAAKLPPMPTTGMLPSYANALRNTTPVLKEGLQTATQTMKPVTSKLASALRTEPSIVKKAPSAAQLELQSENLFNVAKNDGIEINAKDFASNMKQIGKDLENIGYDAELHPDVATVLKRLSDPNVPKDFNKIKALRTMIGELQNSQKAGERKIGSQLKDEFDSYLATIPEESLLGGSKEGITAWKNAMGTWSQLKKSEIFEDLLSDADIKAQRYSQSGKENYLYQKLSDLAVNKKKMRLFTPEEQEAIREAAQGGKMQNLLRMAGKYSPSSVIATAGGAMLGAQILGPAGAAIAPAIGAGAKLAATKIRTNQLKKLAATMRAGAPIVKETNNE